MSQDSEIDMLEEIDDPSDLLSKPLEPLPLVQPPVHQSSSTAAAFQVGRSSFAAHQNGSSDLKRTLPPGFGGGRSADISTNGTNGSSSRSKPTIWRPPPPKQESQTGASSSSNSLIIGGSGARVPTMFLDSSGGFSRPTQPEHAGSLAAPPSTSNLPPSMPGTFPSSSSHLRGPMTQSSIPAASGTTIDLTLSDDEEDENPGSNPSSSNVKPEAINKVDDGDDDDDDDEPVIVAHNKAEREFEIDDVKSNAIVCAGLVNCAVLCMYGLPQMLTYPGTIEQEPPEDPAWSRANWPNMSHFWAEKGYRPVMLALTPISNLPAGPRMLPGGWNHTPAPQSTSGINVSVMVPPLVAHRDQPTREQALAKGAISMPPFGCLAEKYVTAMEPLLRSNKIRCEARSRMVPVGRSQGFVHYIEVLVFARRPDLSLISDRLAHAGIQLDHPSSYHPEDYPTEPQYQNPHNPPPGGWRSNAVQGLYRGPGMGTSVQNKELTEQEKKKQVDMIYSSIKAGEELAAVEPMPIITTKLLPHQKQALGFLINRERRRTWAELVKEPEKQESSASQPQDRNGGTASSSSALVKAEKGPLSEQKGKAKDSAKEPDEDSISLWKVRKGTNGKIRAWRNLITNREVLKQPNICRGAILADDMGLGKTITTLALIAHTLNEAKAFSREKPRKTVELDRLEQTGTGSVNNETTAIVLADDDDDDDEDDDRASRDASSSPVLGLAVHGAPPTSKTSRGGAPPRSPAKKRKKEKIDPEVIRKKHIERRSRGTLIVCPLSVVSNWEDQFREHWDSQKQPRIYIYHGHSRITDTKVLSKFDIVITTYSTLGSEFSNQSTWVVDEGHKPEKQRPGGSGHVDTDDEDGEDIIMTNENGIPVEDNAAGNSKPKGKKRKRKPAKEAPNALQRIEWFRVVLDEAHTIKGAGTWQSKAACNLSAQRRLCLTGTPIQNNVDDLFALMKFLRLEPFTDRAIWNEFCGHTESTGLSSKTKENEPIDSANLGHIQIIMKYLALRRQKTTKTADGKDLLTLPPKLSKTNYLDFEEAEKARYQALHDKYKEDFEEMMSKDTATTNYATILHEILNLRMTCDHPSLVDASKDAKRKEQGADLFAAIEKDGLNREKAAVLFMLYRDSQMAFCNVCQSDLSGCAERDPAREVDELDDALSEVASRGPGKPKRAKSSTASTPLTLSGGGTDTPLESSSSSGGLRPVVTKCQHLFCSSCFRQVVGSTWPNVSADHVESCPACAKALQLVLDAIQLEPSDFDELNQDRAERDLSEEEDSKLDELGSDDAQDDFDWGSDSGDIKRGPSFPRAQRKNGRSERNRGAVADSSNGHASRGHVSLEGRKDLSTKIRALITDLIPFSKCNPFSALYDPTAPRLEHMDVSKLEEGPLKDQAKELKQPVVVMQKEVPAEEGSNLIHKLDTAMATASYEPIKSVVFSQWTKMLDRIQKSLSLTGIKFVRLDGTMRRQDRSIALEKFRTDPGTEVLLISLRAGGTGLNLVSACRAYLMDPYWNPAVENQGLDRIHRMGQMRPVITTKYIMRHSIEENLLRLQKRKLMLAEKVGSRREIAKGAAGAEARREERREELKILFGASKGGVEELDS